MQTLLLAAFALLLRVACASEPTVAGGFYLGRQPISVEQACSIMFNRENFYKLPSLSIIEPLALDDFRLFVKDVSVAQGQIFPNLKWLWKEWQDFLQLSDEHPTLIQCRLLYKCLLEASIAHMMNRVAGGDACSRFVREEGPSQLRSRLDPFQLTGLFATFMLLLLAMCYALVG